MQDNDAKMKKNEAKKHNFGLLPNAGGHKSAVLAPKKTGKNIIYRAYRIIVDLFYRAYSIVNLFTYFRAFSNIFFNILTTLCWVYFGGPRNVGSSI